MPTVLRKANPNRHGWMRLLRYSATEYYVVGPEEDEEIPFFSLNEAEKFFDDRVKELLVTPNWDAQAEYDELWGPHLEQYPSPSSY